MIEYGTLKIYIHCVSMQRMAVVTARKLIVTTHGVTLSEAEAMRKEHEKQADTTMIGRANYEYQWQAGPVHLG
jgi:hypothetical protein